MILECLDKMKSQNSSQNYENGYSHIGLIKLLDIMFGYCIAGAIFSQGLGLRRSGLPGLNYSRRRTTSI